MYGFYPRDEVWRVNLSYMMLAVAVVPLLFDKFPFRKHFLKFTYVFPVIAFFLLNGLSMPFGLQVPITENETSTILESVWESNGFRNRSKSRTI